ncbi:MAG: ATP-dependent DNA helicase RecG [Alicyclobacillaceae bacterium]|nr:ATP-dependent DNA helicase RecG [Alicyclobacillaceae bacterium]
MLRELPVSAVAGVGQAKAKALGELGIQTVHDLLHYFPRRYEDRRIRPYEAFEDGMTVTARAVVEGTPRVRWEGPRSVLTAWLRIDGVHRVRAVWFNQPYVRTKLADGRLLLVTGRYDRSRHSLAVSHTEFNLGDASLRYREWSPVYSTGGRLSNWQLEALIAKALQQYGDRLEEWLPAELTRRYRLVSHREAVAQMHHPDSSETLRQARRRLAFEEFFLFQLQLQWFRAQQKLVPQGEPHSVPDDALPAFEAALPHPLTSAQRRVCSEILADLRSSQPMFRLVQGDVGSGKTWVALWAAYAVWRAGRQSALMAPTEILAEQHAAHAARLLEPLGVPVALLTGSTPPRQRAEVLSGLKSGCLGLVVGTHALLTNDVEFARLGLVITDEQHRFGVAQRAALRAKGRSPDVLMMSATPIPRTLALAVYGDLDVSVIDQLPAGRKPVRTWWLPFREEDKAVRLARRELAQGHQVFVVAPLVEDSERLADVMSAQQLADRLRDKFAGFQVVLLHGRMSSRDKDEAMRAFISGAAQVLVSTTVIEVGIDVSQATVMMVYHADRFGLAQLHQLRGRVGRGSDPGFCVLLADPKSDVARQRLEVLVETHDGFLIAERDLELRGPGEFLGVRQSGLPEFTVGDLTRDLRVMEVARDEAMRLVRNRDFWLLPAYAALRDVVRPQGAEADSLRQPFRD